MKKITILLAGFFFFNIAQAQNNAIQHMDVTFENHAIQSVEINGSDTTINVTQQKEPKLFVVLSDTNNISSFTVKLGTTTGGSDIFQKTFEFDTEGTFQDGTSYTREGNYVRLNLGQLNSFTTYYAQVQATVNGNPQAAVIFSD